MSRRPPTGQRASPDCWHKDAYSFRDVFATEWEVIDMLYGLVRGLQPAVIVEHGAYLGDAAQAMGRALRENGHGVLYSLELDGDLAAKARANTAGLPVDVYQEDAGLWAPPLGTKVEMVWLDGPIKQRAEHYRALAPFVRPGALVAVHDTGARFRHAREAVRELVAEGLLEGALPLPTFRGVTLARAAAPDERA